MRLRTGSSMLARGLTLSTCALTLCVGAAGASEVVAVRAGTVHLVEGGQVIEGGGTLLLEDGKIVAVGKSIAIPRGARVVDYGPGAHIGPGLVAADSAYASPIPAERTAEPGLMALDHFDPYSSYTGALSNGVTSLYLAPARGRLIAGQGAVIKSFGDPETRDERILARSTGLHGSISAEARSTPGFWRPPVPATVDVGMGVELPQLPRSTMGAVVALDELMALARDGSGADFYGPYAGPILAAQIEQHAKWRMGAETAGEVRALLEFFGERDLRLVIDSGLGGDGAAEMASELAAAKVPVLFSPAWRALNDFDGKRPEEWPSYDSAARLAQAGVSFAITPGRTRSTYDLRFAAQVARRGGLSEAQALRAITLSAAEILGIEARVGSLAPGKDADLVVYNGAPMAQTSSLMATWVGGEVAWKVAEVAATVIEVDELHIGDGRILAPGQILMRAGRIVEVGRRVAHPIGATVVHGAAAMPGMIDAYGHLGLEGSRKSFSTRVDLSRIIEAGDAIDRAVARAGVTTVNLASRSEPSKSGSPLMAYKPAAESIASAVVSNPSALHMVWDDSIRTRAGESVKGALEKALEYKTKWEEYEKAIAEWTAPAEEAAATDKAEEAEGDKADESKDEKADDKKDEDKKDDDKKSKKKKGKDDEPARPVTGVWEGEYASGEPAAATHLRLRLNDKGGTLEGNLRCDGLSSILVEISGERVEKHVSLHGLGSGGPLSLELELKADKLEGKLLDGGGEHDLSVSQSSQEYVVAGRTERRRVEPEKPVKGEPRSPGITPDLEPLRQAMLGKGCILVTVTRSDDVLDCVAAFEAYGIRPVLFDASGCLGILPQLQGRVAGILLTGKPTASAGGTKVLNRFAAVSDAGIPVAFQSDAEEGAVELPLVAAYAVAHGMSPQRALTALTAGAADLLGISDRVGRLEAGKDADVLLLDGDPLDLSSRVIGTWVAGEEIR